jgi:hypothetical protein
MSNLYTALVIAIFATGINVNAQSDVGLFLEPAITYEIGNTDANYPSPLSNSSGTSEGFGLGARIGMHVYESFFVGIDGRYSMPNFKDSSVNYDAKSASTNYGPVIGMHMPDMGLRLWGTYIFDGDLNPDRSGSFDVKVQSAEGFRVGAGFRMEAFSLNIEYQELSYDDATLEQLGPFSPGASLNGVQLDNKSWIASVSFPIEL